MKEGDADGGIEGGDGCGLYCGPGAFNGRKDIVDNAGAVGGDGGDDDARGVSIVVVGCHRGRIRHGNEVRRRL